MKELCTSVKELILHPNFHTLVVVLTTVYLIFGVLNAGFIMAQVLASILDYLYHHV